MKYLLGLTMLLISHSALSLTLIGEIIESSSDYTNRPVHTYLLKVKNVFLGEYQWQYKKILVHNILTTKLIDTNRHLLVESVNGVDTILDVYANEYPKASEHQEIQMMLAKAVANTLNEQNQKHQFINHGRLRVLVKGGSYQPELTFTKVYMEPTTIIVIDYYMKNILNQWKDYIPSGEHIAFKVQILDGNIMVLPEKINSGYVSLATAISKYEK